MLKLLVKKQLSEVFKSYFFDAKKNRMRSKFAIAAWFVFFVLIMVGMLGGIFTAMSLSMCEGLASVGMGWLYFTIIGIVAIALGAFGSVFNTYSSLYLSKDNDLLLSLPIPVETIVASRLINVYLMGAMYSATVIIPALIVYWVVAGASAARIVCGILLFFIITVIVLLLSCLLGWVVAKLSLKMKHKSFLTVLASLVFIGLYYFCYFKASDLIREIVYNAAVYGARIKGAAYGLYLFGCIGEGNWIAAAVFTAATAVLFLLIWIVLKRSFLSIATFGGSASKVRYTEKRARRKSAFGAFLGKEFSRFTASPNYMLNCGLAILLIPASGVLLLFMGADICGAIGMLFGVKPGCTEVLLCTLLFMLASMNDMATPSVSLEGKSIWIPQSLPVEPNIPLRAKELMQFILTAIPILFAAVCCTVIVDSTPAVKLLMCVTALAYAAFSAVFNTFLGLKMPLLSWTNEIAPIKQSGAVLISLFGGWAICVAFAAVYLFLGFKLGAAGYLLICTAVFLTAAFLLQSWMDTRGAKAFAEL